MIPETKKGQRLHEPRTFPIRCSVVYSPLSAIALAANQGNYQTDAQSFEKVDEHNGKMVTTKGMKCFIPLAYMRLKVAGLANL